MLSLGPLAMSNSNFNPGIFAQPSKESANKATQKPSPIDFRTFFMHYTGVSKNMSDVYVRYPSEYIRTM